MKFTLEIDMSNAAFEDNPSELSDCLRRVRDALWVGASDAGSGTVCDSNGNNVGKWIITDPAE